MTIEQISEHAYANTEPERETLPERALRLALQRVYRQHRSGAINAEQGAELKRAAIRQYNLDCDGYNQMQDVLAQHAALWRRIEGAANTYRKDPTIAHADAFLEAVYGVGRKE